MNTVCFHKDKSYFRNVYGCVTMAVSKEREPIQDVSYLACGNTDPKRCSEFHGVYLAMQKLVCGVMPYDFCASESGHVSGPGSDYSSGSKSAQYYGLCAIPRDVSPCYCCPPPSTTTSTTTTSTTTSTTSTTTTTTTTTTMESCTDNGCQQHFSKEGLVGECVNVKDRNWTSINQVYNVLTPLKQNLCRDSDCCRCLTKIVITTTTTPTTTTTTTTAPLVCEDVDKKCYNVFKKLGLGGFGICVDVRNDTLAGIDFKVPKQDGLCSKSSSDCCECFMSTVP